MRTTSSSEYPSNIPCNCVKPRSQGIDIIVVFETAILIHLYIFDTLQNLNCDESLAEVDISQIVQPRVSISEI